MTKIAVFLVMMSLLSFFASAASIDFYEPVTVGVVSNAWGSSNFASGYFQDLRNLYVSQQMYVELSPLSQYYGYNTGFGFTLYGSCDTSNGDLVQVFSSQEIPTLNNPFASPYAAGIIRISPSESGINLPPLWTTQCVTTGIGAFLAPLPPGSTVDQTTPQTFATNQGRILYVQQDAGPFNFHIYTPGSPTSPSLNSLRLISLPQFGYIINFVCPPNNQGYCVSPSVALQHNTMYMAIACDINNACFYNTVVA